MNTSGERLEGGCLCGAVRYCLDPSNAQVDYCHCTQCQKASGAPVVTWAQVPPSQFEIIRGEAACYVSSDIGARHFCGNCGSPVYMSDPDNKTIGITTATLDEPSRLVPKMHGWTSAQLSWLHIDDDLPRYSKSVPHDE